MDNENTTPDSNPNERKPRRPRIGQNRTSLPSEGDYRHTDGDDNGSNFPHQNSEEGEHMRRTYPRRQGGFYERQPQQRGYNPDGYQGGNNQRRQYNNPDQPSQGGYGMGNNRRSYDNGGYRQNQGDYQRRQGDRQYQGGYRQQGYGNPHSQGNYPNRRPAPYDDRRQSQGGYSDQGSQRGEGYPNQRRRSGQFANNTHARQQGGYNNTGRNPRGAQGPFTGRGKSFTPRPRQVDYEMPIPDPNEEIRLNKFMANTGICSRREADDFIQQGLVKVNGVVVTTLGTKITHKDVVEYDDKVLALQRKCYVLLNKPKDCVTTTTDPKGRITVMDIVKDACKERIYPVGRLDRNTTGVLLLTNDGDLASRLTHPQYVKKKIYHVWTDRDISEEDMQRIADGIELEDGEIHADAISYATETDRNQAGIEIHSGRNRIVRRIFEHLGYHVIKLDRVYFAGLTKKNLPRGRWRYLTQEEVNFLKMGSFE